MKLDLFDTNLYLGRPTRGAYAPVANVPELINALDRADTKHALVWHVAQRDVSPLTGNAMMSEALTGASSDRLCGCWTILPPQTDPVLCGDFFAQMKRQRIVALRAFPAPHNYLLDRVVFGHWLDEIADRRIPLLLSLEKGATWPVVYRVLEQYPKLTCVLCDIGVWGVDRYTWPLLDHYPNVYVETSLLALEDGGMEAMVAHAGAKRLLYGSGFPERYPESAILELLHAGISETDKQMIASGNLERLLAEAEF